MITKDRLFRDRRDADRVLAGLLEHYRGSPGLIIYRPDTERQSHYFRARIADQFDVVIHIDETRALEPLERTAR